LAAQKKNKARYDIGGFDIFEDLDFIYGKKIKRKVSNIFAVYFPKLTIF